IIDTFNGKVSRCHQTENLLNLGNIYGAWEVDPIVTTVQDISKLEVSCQRRSEQVSPPRRQAKGNSFRGQNSISALYLLQQNQNFLHPRSILPVSPLEDRRKKRATSLYRIPHLPSIHCQSTGIFFIAISSNR